MTADFLKPGLPALTQAAKPLSQTTGDHLRLARHVMAGHIYRRLHEALEEAGIEHLVLKGPHLAEVFYVRPWYRTYNDIDLLVRPSNFQAAIKALVKAGFALQLGRPNRQATRAAAYDATFLFNDGSVIELHRDLSPYGLYAVDPECLFAEARSFEFENTPAKGLAPEDLLVHLVIHAAKSQFATIEHKHLCDIQQVIAGGDMDWALFERRTSAAGCSAAAWFFLQAAAYQDKALVPAGTLKTLAPGRIKRVWAGLWLDLRQFPLLRHKRLPKSIRRLLLGPALVDRSGQVIKAGARFFKTRLADQWLRFKSR